MYRLGRYTRHVWNGRHSCLCNCTSVGVRSIAISVSVCLSARISTRAQQLLRWPTVWPQYTYHNIHSQKSRGLLCAFQWGGELDPI